MKRIVSILFLLAALAIAPRIGAQSLPCPTGDTCSGSVGFTVTFQSPTTPASVSPNAATAGSAQLTLTLTAATGSTFNSTMIVEWCEVTPTPCASSTALTTTFVSSTSMTAVVPAAQLVSSGTFAVYIAQPNGGHAQNVSPNEADPTLDAVICKSCLNFPAELLIESDFVLAVKG